MGIVGERMSIAAAPAAGESSCTDHSRRAKVNSQCDVNVNDVRAPVCSPLPLRCSPLLLLSLTEMRADHVRFAVRPQGFRCAPG